VEDIQKKIISGGLINVDDFTFRMTINLLCSLIFGRRYTDSLSSETDELKHCLEIVNNTNNLFLKPNPGDIFPWLAWMENYQGWTKDFKEFNQLCRRVFGQSIEVHFK
jgi:Cytochrome P450